MHRTQHQKFPVGTPGIEPGLYKFLIEISGEQFGLLPLGVSFGVPRIELGLHNFLLENSRE